MELNTAHTDPGPATTAPDTQPYPANLDRESPLPMVEPNVEDLFTHAHTGRDRRLGTMALGEHRDSWY